ncbi:hypothetical protein LIER_25119 [Lithospermum erythrorhizon]|uniref:Uncharacterized protein n=1 Tax=Lithospermum erythrorhizon TaxID=34254 RepID=A0AAV3R7U8_LITER
MKNELISFSDKECVGIELPHNDPVVIAPVIVNFTVERLLMNTVGEVTLDSTVGKGTRISTIRAQFIVADLEDASYNGLIGRPILTVLRAIVSPFHKMKFPSVGGIGESCDDQKKARVCYQTSVPPLNKGKSEQGRKRSRGNHMEVNTVRNEEEEDNSPKQRDNEKKGEPHEEVEEIRFEQGKADKTFRIGTKLGEEHKQRLIALVREYADIFAWGPKDMPGINPKVAMHKVYVLKINEN